MTTDELHALYGVRLNVLTDRQAEVLGVILGGACRHGATPTVREIGVALGIRSPNGVYCHLRSLARKGFIETMDGHRLRLKGLRFQAILEDSSDS